MRVDPEVWRLCPYLFEWAQFRVCCLHNLDAVFPKDLFPDYLETTTAVVVPCGGPRKSPCTSIQCCYFYSFWSFGTVGFNTHFENRVVLKPGLASVSDVASAIISHEQTQ